MDYRVATAMRGPDILNGNQRSHLSRIKYHLTGRLRAAYYSDRTCFGLRVSKLIEQHEVNELLESISVLNRLSPLGWKHVASHIVQALPQIPQKKRKALFGPYLLQILKELGQA